MFQCGLLTKDRDEYAEYLEGVAGSSVYRGASSVLLQIYIENWDVKTIRDIILIAKETLPKSTLVGMTNRNQEYMEMMRDDGEYDIGDSSIAVNLVFFDSSWISVKCYNTSHSSGVAAGGQFGVHLSGQKDAKGVLLLVAGMMLEVDDFLAMATAVNEGIPFFGAHTAVCDHAMSGTGMIFHDEKILEEGFLTVIFHGRDLHIRTGYNFGWSPIGKKMTITKVRDARIVEEIDGRPAAKVYEKYLGLSVEQLVAENLCEFPFSYESGERSYARMGFGIPGTEELFFTAQVCEGDELRLTYGNADDILNESFQDSEEVRQFEPQALWLVACLNRATLLKEEINIEHGFYKDVASSMAVIHGNGEILYDEKGGGEMISALVTVAMREGDRTGNVKLNGGVCRLGCAYRPDSIPLIRRMTTFLEATTRDMQEAVAQAKAANEAKTAFLSNVSHEIRTPINAVLGLDEMILRETKDDNIRHYATDIQNSGRTLLSLINDILDSSRIESGKMEIIPVEYELSSALNDLVNMTKVRAEEKGLEFIVKVDESIPHLLYGDDTRLKQCALNILTNAVKYTKEGSVTMEVACRTLPENKVALEFTVTDTGIGIKEEDLSKLTARFERIEESRNRSIEGTGLGMSIVTSLLSMMDSALIVDSVYGKGSTFSFTVVQKVVNPEPIGDFTRMYEQSIESVSAYSETFHAPDARILVVDDTRMNLTVIRGLLKDTQIGIDTVESGEQALVMVEKKQYDIIFMDQKMPEMDGIETYRRMKHMPITKNRRTPVIMLTANAVSGAREMFMAEGFDDYLTKPVDSRRLEKMILDRLPPEKVHRLTEEEQQAIAQSAEQDAKNRYEDAPFLAALSEIPGLSVEDGLRNCMNEELLQETVHDFVVSAKSGPDEIQGYLDAADIANYTIRVHALKSSARIIGAGELSEQAKHLEACGDNGDTEEIREKTPKLLEDYRRLAEQLAAALNPEQGADGTEGAAQEEAQDGPPMPDEEFFGAMQAVRELVEAFDFDGAADLVAMLSGYILSKEARRRIGEIADRITRLERDKILQMI